VVLEARHPARAGREELLREGCVAMGGMGTTRKLSYSPWVADTSPGRLAHPNTRVLISRGLALRERGTLLVPADLPQTTERRARSGRWRRWERFCIRLAIVPGW
jgi:hypothetical protein